MYKLKNDYDKAYYYFDKCLKYYNYLNKKKKIDLNKASLVENRLKVKINLVFKILNELNHVVVGSTELLDTDTTAKPSSPQPETTKINEIQTDLNNLITNKPLKENENLNQEEIVPVNQHDER